MSIGSENLCWTPGSLNRLIYTDMTHTNAGWIKASNTTTTLWEHWSIDANSTTFCSWQFLSCPQTRVENCLCFQTSDD